MRLTVGPPFHYGLWFYNYQFSVINGIHTVWHELGFATQPFSYQLSVVGITNVDNYYNV